MPISKQYQSRSFSKGYPNSRTIANELPTNCLGVFDHFVKLALKGLSLQGDQKKL